MVFSSISFLYVFLPAVLLLYFVLPGRFRNGALLLFSFAFCFFGAPVFSLLLIFSSLTDFFISLGIEKSRGTKRAKLLLACSIAINLILLVIFRYAGFLIGTANALLGTSWPLPRLALPLGAGILALQSMSYTMDVYTGKVKAEKNLATLAAFVCLFPKLAAGPVVRYGELTEALGSRSSGREDLYQGICRFVAGLGKTVLLAGSLGQLCVQFKASGGQSVLLYWLYALSCAFCVYYRFSGCSDMAIGLGRIFGFQFPENFNYPFTAKSMTQFYKRWFITLGRWFQDYLYIPLRVRRGSARRWIFCVMLVWLFTGLWYGPGWNFALWGLFTGLLLVLEKLGLLKWLKRSGNILPHVYVALVSVFGFVIFSAESLGAAFADLGGLFGAQGLPFWSFETGYYLKSYGLVLLAAIIGATPWPKMLWKRFLGTKAGGRIAVIAEPVFVLLVMIAVTAFLTDGSMRELFYFK